MKELLLIKESIYGGEEAKCQIGFWDEKEMCWRLNDDVAVYLIELVERLGWGNTASGEVPRMEIVLR